MYEMWSVLGMIISEKQIMQLIQVLVDSISIVGASTPFNFSQEHRRKLADEILSQQSEELKVIE